MYIFDIYDSSKPFINADGIEYLNEYLTNYRSIDAMMLLNRYPDKVLIPLCEDSEKRDIIINAVLYVNDYKYRNLYRTTIQNYNPIENYDRMEEGQIIDTTTKTGTEQRTTTGNNTRENAQSFRTSKSGSELTETTNNLTETANIGNEKTIVENGVKAFNDTDTYADDSKSTTTSDSHTNTVENTGTISNNTTFNDRNDNTSGTANETETISNTDKLEFSNRQDSNVRTFQNYRIHGNIGVTTTAQMLEGERKLSYFSFIEIIFKDIMNEITKGVWLC